MNTKSIPSVKIERNEANPGKTNEKGKTHGVPFFIPLFNPIVKSLLRIGVHLGPMTLLTVRGRKTGKPRTTPMGMFERDGRRYLFATFGDVNWVRNLRAAGEAILTHSRRKEAVVAIELTPEEAAPILRDVFAPYLGSRMGASFLRMGYDLAPNASMDDFINEARNHPGFELRKTLPA